MRRRVLAWIAHVCVLLLVSCGGGGGSSTGSTGQASGGGVSGNQSTDYYPLMVGNKWLYSDLLGSVSTARVTGTAAVAVGTAFVVETVEGMDRTTDMYVHATNGVTWYPPKSADPLTAALGSLQVLRFPVVPGESWTSIDKTLTNLLDLDSDGRFDTVSIRIDTAVVGFESVVTRAGSYSDAAHLQSVMVQTANLSSTGAAVTVTATSDDWYAPGIGPVRNMVTINSSLGQSSKSDSSTTGWRVGERRSESIAPTILSKNPENGGLVGGCCVAITVTFSEAMDLANSVNAPPLQVVGANGKALNGRTSWDADAKRVSFIPSTPFPSGVYTASVTQGALDLVGNVAPATSWQVTIDESGPGIQSSTPGANETEVPLDAKIVFTLDEDPVASTLNSYNIRLRDQNNQIECDMTVNGRTVTLTPRAPLKTGGRYQISVVDVEDKFGNKSSAVWSFTADPGRFAAPAVLLNAVNVGVSAVAVGDLDGDAVAEIVMATGSGVAAPDADSLFVFRHQADGSLVQMARFAGIFDPTSPVRFMTVNDLDGSGRGTIVAATTFGNSIELPQPQLSGTLARSKISTLTGGQVVVKDLDGDGIPELIVGSATGGSLDIYRRDASGAYLNPIQVKTGVLRNKFFAVGDVNGDGRPDLVLVDAYWSGDRITILHQLPGGTFVGPVSIDVSAFGSITSAAIGDVNGDGRSDLLLTMFASTSFGVMLQDSKGTLGAMNRIGIAEYSDQIRLADIDNDGRLDVVSYGSGGAYVVVNRQRTDGALGAAELFPVGVGGFAMPNLLAVGDVNGDGLRDIVFSGAWLRQRTTAYSPPPVRVKALATPNVAQAVNRASSRSMIQRRFGALSMPSTPRH